MLRPLMIATLLLGTSAVAQAQTDGGPPIAYVKRASNGDEIYLVNPDKTGLVRLYKAPSKVQITMLDLRPGGGEVAFLEGYVKLRVLAFDAYGRAPPGYPRTIRTVSSPCTVESPDYHPSNGTLIFVEGCGRDRAVRSVQQGASAPDASSIFANVAVFRARWSRDGALLYYIGLRSGATSSDPTYLYRYSLADSVTSEVGVQNDWQTFDVARVGEKLFWGNNNNFWMLDFATGATTSDATQLNCPRGTRMSRSQDDLQAVFLSPQTRGKGNYVMIGVTSCSTDATALTGAGDWGSIDWRSDISGAGEVTQIVE